MTLRLEALTKTFPGHRHRVFAVRDFTLEIPAGLLTVILGPSGCGKSTLLRLIAGLEFPDSGKIFFDKRDFTALPPERRHAALVFQEDSLIPSMTLAQQIAWVLPREHRTNAEEVQRLLTLGGLAGLGDRLPHQLSGGERQRGAVVRALASRPNVLLLDEPFNRLDAPLRDAMRREVRLLLRSTGTTAVLVTHDQEEALSLADHLVIMREGTLIQEGHPHQVYSHPRDAFTARFLGRANLLRVFAQGYTAESPLGPLPLETPAQGEVLVMIRPEHLRLVREGRFLIREREFRGHDVTWRLIDGDRELIVHTDWDEDFLPGQRVGLELRRPAVVLSESD